MKTLERYRGLARTHIDPALGHLGIDALRPLHLEAAYTEWLKSGRRDGKPGGLSPRTVLHAHRLIRKSLQLHREMRALNESELHGLLAVARELPWYPAIVVLAYCGLRRGEALALRWNDIELDRGTMAVRRPLEQTRAGVALKSPKSGRSRVIAIPPTAVQALGSRRVEITKQRLAFGAVYKNDDLVFAQACGKPLIPHTFGDALRLIVAKAMKRVPRFPRIRLHDLRHTHASLLLKSGAHLKITSGRLGHSTVAVTGDLYSHIIDGLHEEAAGRFEDLMRRGEADKDPEAARYPGVTRRRETPVAG